MSSCQRRLPISSMPGDSCSTWRLEHMHHLSFTHGRRLSQKYQNTMRILNTALILGTDSFLFWVTNTMCILNTALILGTDSFLFWVTNTMCILNTALILGTDSFLFWVTNCLMSYCWVTNCLMSYSTNKCQLDEHWDCFKGNNGETSEKWGGTHMGFSHCIYTTLDWTQTENLPTNKM